MLSKFSKLSFILSTLVAFSLAACGGGGSTPAVPAAAETAPTAPNGVIAASATSQVTLSWAQVAGASSYNIYWGSTAGISTSSSKISGVASPYIHTGRSDGNTYFYRVSAVNSAGETLADEIFSYLYTGGNPPSLFAYTGINVVARSNPVTCLLPNGKVLIAGGSNGGAIFSSAELYNPPPGGTINDPLTGGFIATGGMSTPRAGHTLTLLPNGKVVVIGGQNAGGGTGLTSAEIYDPATGVFSATGSMASARLFHTATLLPNGKVLVAGGIHWPGSGPTLYLSSAELYDPATGAFSATGSMASARMTNATLLPNGKVLVAGGQTTGALNIASSELYDPVTGNFSPAGSMASVRGASSATLLANGKVLVAGGSDVTFTSLTSAELYDPATGTFSATGSMAFARGEPRANFLPNGKVIVTQTGLTSAELYDAATGNFSATGSLSTTAIGPATVLWSGYVLFVQNAIASEVYRR